MEKTTKRVRISTKPLKSLKPPQQFRYIGSEDNEWNTVTGNSVGVIYYLMDSGYKAQNNKMDGVRVIVRK